MAVQQLLSWPQAALWQANERLAQAELHHRQHLHPDWPLLREYPLSPDLQVFSQL